MADRLNIAVRAWTVNDEDPEPTARRVGRAGRVPVSRFPDHALIFDTETTTDQSQALMFGAWRYCRITHGRSSVEFECVQEGLFYADDLAETDLAGYELLRRYARCVRPDVSYRALDASRDLSLLSRSDWAEKVLHRVAYKLRGAVICFNAPFDLSRVAWKVGKTRHHYPDKRDTFEGGFSFVLCGWTGPDGERRESRYRPRGESRSQAAT